MVSLPTIRKAEVIDFFADGEEIQAGFLAYETQADPYVGPSAADGLGNSAVVGGQPPGGPSVPKEFVEALPCPGPVLPANPAQIGTHRFADGGEPQAGCKGNPFLPAGDPEQVVPGAEFAPDNRRIPSRLLDRCQMDASDVHQPSAYCSEIRLCPIRSPIKDFGSVLRSFHIV
jgi:hypothetical protein